MFSINEILHIGQGSVTLYFVISLSSVPLCIDVNSAINSALFVNSANKETARKYAMLQQQSLTARIAI